MAYKEIKSFNLDQLLNSAAGEVALFTCPAGKTWVILAFFQRRYARTGTTSYLLRLRDASGPPGALNMLVNEQSSITTLDTQSLRLDSLESAVLRPGDKITGEKTAGGTSTSWYYHLSVIEEDGI